MIDFQDIQTATARLEGHVRRTPVLELSPQKDRLPGDYRLFGKLENLQITGSFKARGAMNKALSLSGEELRRGLVAASGGNHGAGVAYAGHVLDVPATIYLPGNTPEDKVAKLESWGAKVIIHGDVWDDANQAALEVAEAEGLTYLHPFADPQVIAGQGTIALELADQIGKADILLVAIGGGGLMSGVATAAKALNPDIRIIGVEAAGAPTLHDSVQAGELVTLPGIETKASSLAPRRSEAINLGIIWRLVDDIILLEDDEMYQAARWMWREFGIAAEMSAAAGIAALQTGKLQPEGGQTVCSVICGAGKDGF